AEPVTSCAGAVVGPTPWINVYPSTRLSMPRIMAGGSVQIVVSGRSLPAWRRSGRLLIHRRSPTMPSWIGNRHYPPTVCPKMCSDPALTQPPAYRPPPADHRHGLRTTAPRPYPGDLPGDKMRIDFGLDRLPASADAILRNVVAPARSGGEVMRPGDGDRE